MTGLGSVDAGSMTGGGEDKKSRNSSKCADESSCCANEMSLFEEVTSNSVKCC